jgi:hypothetical protein
MVEVDGEMLDLLVSEVFSSRSSRRGLYNTNHAPSRSVPDSNSYLVLATNADRADTNARPDALACTCIKEAGLS